MTSTRVSTAVALAVLACLIAAATTLATTTAASQPPVVPSHLVVGAGPPSTATGVLQYTDSSGISITADVRLDVPARAAQLVATASVSIVTVSVTLRALGDEVYAQLPGFASLLGEPWTATRTPRVDREYAFLATELRHPQFARLHANVATAVRSATGTTTTLRFASVSVPAISGLPLDLPRHGHLVVSIHTGASGQVLGITLHLWNRIDDVRASFEVTSYDQPVSITAPRASEVAVLTRSRTKDIFGIDTPGILRTLGELGVRVAGR